MQSLQNLLKTLFDNGTWEESWQELVDRETLRYAWRAKELAEEKGLVPCVISEATYIPASDVHFTMPENFSLDFDISPNASFPTSRAKLRRLKMPAMGVMVPSVVTSQTTLARTDYEYVSVTACPGILDFDASA